MSEYFSRAFLLKFLKFGIVGFSGVFVDFGVTYACKEWLKIQKYIANSIGFIVAASSNYFFNRTWTFRSQNPEVAKEYTEFFIISLVGLGIADPWQAEAEFLSLQAFRHRHGHDLEFLRELLHYVCQVIRRTINDVNGNILNYRQ
jgi:putative flippase GtrA